MRVKYFTRCFFISVCLLINACVSGHIGLSPDEKAMLENNRATTEIMQLQARYFELVDLMENNVSARPESEQMVSQLFNASSKWTLEVPGQDNIGYQNTDGMTAFVAWLESFHAEHIVFKHVMLNPQIMVDGDTASSAEQLLMLTTDKRGAQLYSGLGVYTNKFKKNAEGRWRFQEIHLRFNSNFNWPRNSK